MRVTFFDSLIKHMKENEKIYFLTGDLGYPRTDEIQKKFKDRFINCGASEQAMLDMAVGMTYNGKIPFVYSITPFLVFRAMETIRNYINREKAPVKLIGAGRGKDYKHDGFSHWANDVPFFMSQFPNVESKYPNKKEEIPVIVKEMIQSQKPYFLNLMR